MEVRALCMLGELELCNGRAGGEDINAAFATLAASSAKFRWILSDVFSIARFAARVPT